MEPVLYIDVLFLVNWMMDAVILILTGRFLKRRIRLWAVSMAAAVGALWVCLCAAFSLSGWRVRIVGLIPVAFCLVQMAYPSRMFRDGLRAYLCFYLAAILTGGLIHVVYDNTALGRFWRLWMAGSEAEAVSVWLLAAAMAGSFFVIECGLRYQDASKNRELIQDVTLYYQGRQLTVAALWDSGNQLYDPFTGRPVQILEWDVCRELLGQETGAYLQKLVSGSVNGEALLPVRMIPCSSLGDAHGLVPVISITRMETASGNHQDRPLIGICMTSLSTDHSYRMLLHSQTDKKRRNLKYDY